MGPCTLSRGNEPVELVNYPRYIRPGLTIWRYSMPPVYGSGSRVVGCQRQRKVVMVALEQTVQVGASAIDVIAGGEGIAYAKIGCRTGHELHQALCSGMAHRADISAALLAHHARQQVHIKIVSISGLRQQLVQFGGGEFALHLSCG